jgi:hypothetical protein
MAEALPSGGGRWIWSADEALDVVRPKLVSAGLAKEGSVVDHVLALAFARHVVPFGWVPGFVDNDFFLLEGLVGADVLAEAMISVLEEISRNEWKRAHRSSFAPFLWLGFVVLRVSDEAGERVRQRLVDVHAKKGDEGGPISAALDLVLFGAAGARRSAPRHGPAESDIHTWHAVFVDDDPAFLTAVVNNDRFDRTYGARLAFLGDGGTRDAVLRGWYMTGDAKAQGYFLATFGQIKSETMAATVREAARSSRIKAEAAAWLAARGLPAEPPAPVPGAVVQGSIASCRDDFEYGFVILSGERAERLQGDPDHTILSAAADPTSPDAVGAEIYEGHAAFFCLASCVALAPTADGALVYYGWERTDEEILERLDAVRSSDWLPVTTLEVETGRLAGLSAVVTLEEARAQGNALEVTLPPGQYEVRRTRARDDDEDDGVSALWLRRC